MVAKPRPRRARKLLIASAGVATASFLACGGTSVANLMAPPPCDAANAIPALCDGGSPEDAGGSSDQDGGDASNAP